MREINIVNVQSLKPMEIALLFAAKRGVTSGLKAIIHVIKNDSTLGDINVTTADEGYTALHIIIQQGESCQDCFDILMEQNDIRADILDHQGKTALHYAIEQKTDYFFKKLTSDDNHIRTDFNLHGVQAPSPLELAITQNYTERASVLLQLGADPDIVMSSDKNRLLSYLVKIGNAALVETLLLNGADTNMSKSNGEDLLMEAIDNGHAAVVEVLLRFGYGIGRILPPDKLSKLALSVNYCWLVGSQIDITGMDMAIITPEQMKKSQAEMQTLREQLQTVAGNPLHSTFPEDCAVLLRRLETEWNCWFADSARNAEVRKFYFLLKNRDSSHITEYHLFIHCSIGDYLFAIPYRKLESILTLVPQNEEIKNLLRFIEFRNPNGQLARLALKVIQNHEYFQLLRMQCRLFFTFLQNISEEKNVDVKQLHPYAVEQRIKELLIQAQDSHISIPLELTEDLLKTLKYGISNPWKEQIDKEPENWLGVAILMKLSEDLSQITTDDDLQKMQRQWRHRQLQATLQAVNSWETELHQLRENLFLHWKPITLSFSQRCIGHFFNTAIILFICWFFLLKALSDDIIFSVIIAIFMVFIGGLVFGCCVAASQRRIGEPNVICSTPLEVIVNTVIHGTNALFCRMRNPRYLSDETGRSFTACLTILNALQSHLSPENHAHLLSLIRDLLNNTHLTLYEASQYVGQLSTEFQHIHHHLEQEITNTENNGTNTSCLIINDEKLYRARFFPPQGIDALPRYEGAELSVYIEGSHQLLTEHTPLLS